MSELCYVMCMHNVLAIQGDAAPNPDDEDCLCSHMISHACAGPAMLVYDNACNFHKYALRRAPQFFAKTLFRIDRLHIFNHHG
jgi:hypothetical protein